MLKRIKKFIAQRRMENQLIEKWLKERHWVHRIGEPRLHSLNGSFISGNLEVRFSHGIHGSSYWLFYEGLDTDLPRVAKAIYKRASKIDRVNSAVLREEFIQMALNEPALVEAKP